MATVDLPLPLGPTRATRSPGGDVQVQPLEDRGAVAVGEGDVGEVDVARAARGRSMASGRSVMAGARSRSWKMRSTPARACWPMVSTPASRWAGATSWVT